MLIQLTRQAVQYLVLQRYTYFMGSTSSLGGLYYSNLFALGTMEDLSVPFGFKTLHTRTKPIRHGDDKSITHLKLKIRFL